MTWSHLCCASLRDLQRQEAAKAAEVAGAVVAEAAEIAKAKPKYFLLIVVFSFQFACGY